MTTYIHVGYPKTATKFLQFEIFPKLDLDYFFVGGTPKGKYKIMRRILDDLRKPNNNFQAPYYKEHLNRIIDPSRDTLISFESLTGEIFNPDTRDMYTTAVRLNDVLDFPKIIVCTREEKTMIKSLYSQYIKEGGTLTRSEFESDFFNHERLNYEQYISHLYEVFGHKNVCVVEFELLKRNSRTFVQKLCDFMDQDPPEFKNKKLNPSYSEKQMEVQRFLNKFFKTELNPKGLPPSRLWHIWNPPKKLINNRIARRLING